MKVLKIIFLVAGAIVFITVIGSCVSLGSKVNHDQNTSNKVSQVISQVHTGMTTDEVKSILGEPDDVNSTTGDYGMGQTTMELWMYGTLSDKSYMLDFENGTLQSITQG